MPENFGTEFLIPALMAIVGLIVGLLRVYGMEKAIKYIEAASPVIVEAINRAKADGKITSQEAKNEALRAAKEILPIWLRMAAFGGVQGKAGTIIERAHLKVNKYGSEDTTKRIQSLGIAASTDGKALGAEIKANFKRGNLSLLGGTDGKKPRFGIGGTFKF